MNSIFTKIFTLFLSLTLAAQAATCFNTQGSTLGSSSVWQGRESGSEHWILQNARGEMSAPEIILGIRISPLSLCWIEPIIQEFTFAWQEASMAAERPSLDSGGDPAPGGFPVFPPASYSPTITAPVFTETLEAEVPLNVLALNQNSINQESLGVVPEPSTGMLGAISLILLWCRKMP